MKRGIVRSTAALLLLAVFTAAGSPGVGQWRPVYLRVLLPEADAELKNGDPLTKQTGTSRLFVSPPLEPGQAFTYTLTATWEPNNYTTVIRTRKVSVQAGREVEVDLRKADPRNP